MTDLLISPQTAPLRGVVPVPSDKSITHRALILGALAFGESTIRASRIGEDNRSTLAALAAMGVQIREDGEVLRVTGVGLDGLREPSSAIDCGNSGTTMRLLAGVLAAQRFKTVLVGDASLSKRPMARIAKPLRLRGARIEGALSPKKVGEITPPLEIGPLPAPNVLSALRYDLPIPSAQVKSAILLSGLYADGKTTVSEPMVSRDHTERMLASLGVPIARVGGVVELDGSSWTGKLAPFEMRVPGDLSAAAFLLAAAVLVPGSDVGVRDVGINPTRSGFVDALRAMGAELAIQPEGESLGEPIGSLRAVAGGLNGATLAGEVVARSIDEVPILAALAARANGTTRILDAAELRVKESDRLATMAHLLRSMGVECEELPDGLIVVGRPDRPLVAAEVDSEGDHRIAMAAAVLGLLADGETRVKSAQAIATSFPRFVGTMRALGARIEVC